MPAVAVRAPGRSNLRSRSRRAVGGDQREREQDREARQRHVDEEDRLPAERLREHAAEQHADDQAGRAGAAPDRDGAVALPPFGERGVDERQRGREDERAAEALHRARDEQELGLGREPAAERGAGVQREAGDEDPPAAEQVGGAAAEQQEAGGRHGVGADHRLQRLRRVAQVPPDLRQRHDDDVLIERDDQHRERQQRQRRRPAVATRSSETGRCFGEGHGRAPVQGRTFDYDPIRNITYPATERNTPLPRKSRAQGAVRAAPQCGSAVQLNKLVTARSRVP